MKMIGDRELIVNSVQLTKEEENNVWQEVGKIFAENFLKYMEKGENDERRVG